MLWNYLKIVQWIYLDIFQLYRLLNCFVYKIYQLNNKNMLNVGEKGRLNWILLYLVWFPVYHCPFQFLSNNDTLKFGIQNKQRSFHKYWHFV